MTITRARAYGETALFLLIEFGVLALLLFVESIDVLFSVVVIVISIIYGIIVYFVSKPREGDVDGIGSSNRRRIGVGILFFIGVTILAYLFPLRGLNIIAVFMTLDVLLSLLPGKAVLYGREFWGWSKVVYVLTLVVALGFLVINLFGVPVEQIITFLSGVSGLIFLVLVVVFVIIVLLGLLGIKLEQ